MVVAAQPLTVTGFDTRTRTYTAVAPDGVAYRIDADAVAGAEQMAERNGWPDPDWDTSMDGVIIDAEVMTRAEAARFLGVSPTQVARLVAQGRLPTVPLPDAGIRRDDVERYARSRRGSRN